MKKSSLYRELRKTIKNWQKDQGTDFSCAFRDALTDLRHMADAEFGTTVKDSSFHDRLDASYEAYLEELQLDKLSNKK